MNERRKWPAILVVAGFSGCAVGPNYRTPQTAVPSQWSRSAASGSTTQPADVQQPADLATWWKALGDPTLDGLIAEAVESNLDLRVATGRVREARAARDVAAADFWPQVNLSGAYEYSQSSLNVGPDRPSRPGLLHRLFPTLNYRPAFNGNPSITTLIPQRVSFGNGVGTTLSIQPSPWNLQSGPQAPSMTITPPTGAKTPSRQLNVFRAGFDASWELDVFGRIRRAVEAAEADLESFEDDRRNVLVILLSEVTLNYVELRGAQRRLEVAFENITSQSDTVQLTRSRHKAGFISELDVAQAEAQLATTQSQVPLLESMIRQSIYQLSVLLGRPPVALVDELDRRAPIPATPPTVPIGLPSEVLRRRPDIRAAERQLAAATARIGVAVADLFPTFSLTGSFGPDASDIRRILDRRSLGWSVGPGFTWPVFEGGRIRANIEVQNARQEQAIATYEKTVLTAFSDVESALIAYANELRRHDALAKAVVADQRSLELSSDLYGRGLAAFLNVLDSQRALYAAQDALIQSETTVVTDLIALYKALGGGWESPPE